MSRKANVLLLAAVSALGISLTVGAAPLVESMLNDYTVKGVQIAQVDDAGRCIVIVTVNKGGGADEVRAVATSSGDVRVFSDLGGVTGLIKRSSLDLAAVTTYKRKNKEAELGDPLVTLKAKYKAFKLEKLTANKSKLSIDTDIVALTALGYNTAVGTVEAAEWADVNKRLVTVTEWYDFAAAKVVFFAAALTAAGIDPATVV